MLTWKPLEKSGDMPVIPDTVTLILRACKANAVKWYVVCSPIKPVLFVFTANLDALDSSFRKQTLMGLVNFLPILEFMPKLMKTDKILANNLKLRDDYAREQMKLHSETYDAENPRDYIDAYVSRMHQLQAEKKETTFEGGYFHCSPISRKA